MSKRAKEQQKKRRKERARRNRLNVNRSQGSSRYCYVPTSTNVVALEIHEERAESHPPLSPEGIDKLSDAIELSQKGKYKEAIKLLTEVNTKEPGRPSVIYNLAAFHLLHDRNAHEAFDATIDMLVRDYPDYFFGKTAYAERLIRHDQLEEAWEILQSLYQRKRLHITEFKTLSSAAISYHLAAGQKEIATELHQSVVEIVGDSFPSMESFHTTFAANIFSRLAAMGGNRRRKKTATKKEPGM